MEIKRIPLKGTFELTAGCNLRCKMCMIRIDNADELYSNERTAKEWINMAEQVRQAGTLELLLTGGEPMSRPDFVDIYTEIASMGFILTLYTNATMISQDIYKVLQKYPPHKIGITVYGASAKTYEKVTGFCDAYDRMLMGMDKLRQLPSGLTIRTTIVKDNFEDMDKILEWADGLGPKVSFNVNRIVTMPVRGGSSDVKNYRLTPEQNVDMLKKIYTRSIIKIKDFIKNHPEISTDKDNADILNNSLNNREEEQNYKESDIRQTIYGCDAGMDSYTITWDGKLIGCQMLDDCCTYPFEDGFTEAWNRFPQKVKLMPLPEKCKGCNTRCMSCFATRLSETGRMDGWPEYICREGKLKEKMEEDLAKSIYEGIVPM